MENGNRSPMFTNDYTRRYNQEEEIFIAVYLSPGISFYNRGRGADDVCAVQVIKNRESIINTFVSEQLKTFYRKHYKENSYVFPT